MTRRRLLFLWDNRLHAEPMIRVLPDLRDRGWDTTQLRLGTHGPADVLRANPAEVVICHASAIDDALLSQSVPLVALDRIDGAQLSSHGRRLITYPIVRQIWKGYRLRPLSLYNEPADRWHAKILCDLPGAPPRSLHDPQQQPAIADASLAKIRCVYGFGAYAPAAQAMRRNEPRGHRTTLAFFAGTITGDSEIAWHRRQAVKALQDMKRRGLAVECHTGRPLDRPQFHSALERCRVAVCPWGWGEASHRHYEALICGAVPVSPDSSHAEGWPDLFGSGWCEVCRPDFADLEEVCLSVQSRWDALAERRREARAALFRYYQKSAIAVRLATLLEELA